MESGHESPARLFEGLLAADALLLKALNTSELAEGQAIERRLFQALGTTFLRRADAAVKAAIRRLGTSDKPVTRSELGRLLAAIEGHFDGWDKETSSLIRAATEQAYRLGKTAVLNRVAGLARGPLVATSPHLTEVKKAEPGAKKPPGRQEFQIRPSFSVVDQNAIDALAQHHTFWVGRHYSTALADRISAVSEDILIRRGLGRRDAARALQTALAAEFGLDPEAPFARGAGIEIPSGWRGRPIQYFEGLATNTSTVARVHGSMRGLAQVGATHYTIVNPDDERTCERCKFMDGKTFEVNRSMAIMEQEIAAPGPATVREIHPWPSASAMTASKDPVGDGFGYPPFHFRCRCTVDISADAEFQPVVPATPEAGKFQWSEGQLHEVDRPYTREGMHTKLAYQDPNGGEWLWKPQPEFRALGDRMSADMARALGIETPDVFVVNLGGKSGSIQTVFTDVAGSAKGLAPATLTEAQALELQKQHIFDWLISQHDTHSGNVLVMRDGSLRFIDKGQTFRFFGADELTLGYGRPGTPNPTGTYYHDVFQAFSRGEAVSLAEVEKLEGFLSAIESLPEEQFVSILRPYARAASEAAARDAALRRAAWMGRYTEDEFIAAALERKRGIRASVEQFYRQLAESRPAARSAPSVARFKEFLGDAREGGLYGRSVFVGGADYEGGNWLMYQIEGDGLIMETRLRAAADRRLLALLEPEGAVATVARADPYHDDILKTIKSFNYHLKAGGDGVVPAHAAELYETLLAKLRDASAASKTAPAYRAMATHYEELLKKYRTAGGEWNREMLGRTFERFVIPPEAAPPLRGLPQGWKIEKLKVSSGSNADVITTRQLRDGRIHTSARTRSEKGREEDNGRAFRITAPDGTQFSYRPFDTGQVGQQGELRLWLPEGATATPAQAQRAFAQLETLGLRTAEATPAELEAIHLRKIAFKYKLDSAATAIAEDLPVAEQTAQLRALLQREGIRVGQKLGPTFDHAGRARGWGRWVDTSAVSPSGDITIFHNTDDSIPELLDTMLGGGTRGLVSTRERLRLGISTQSGMSPGRDMTTGGGSYVFTRIKPRSFMQSRTGFFFRSDALADLDAFSYDDDRYGRISELHRRLLPKELSGMSTPGNGNNETCFKNGLSLERWLEQITVPTEQVRQRTLEVFRRHGITKIGGRDIEDIVRATQ